MKTKLLAIATITISIGTASAAEKIRYEDLPLYGGTVANRSVKVTTTDGQKHSGNGMNLEYDHVRVFQTPESWEDVPRENVAKIEISQRGRFLHGAAGSLEIFGFPAALCADSGPGTRWLCDVAAYTIFSPILLYEGARSLGYLAAEAGAFFIQAKAWEIAP